jgi:hypothetical protein
MTTTVRKPLKFYSATAVKRICLDNGFVEADGAMFVAKWEGLYVIARDVDHYFVVSEAQAAEYVRTERDEKGKLKVATNAPMIYAEGSRFQWTVECGRTCPDSCDETVGFTQTVNNKAEAEALVAALDGTQYRNPRDFLRIRGPAFYQIKRPTPRPAPVAVPNTATRRSPTLTNPVSQTGEVMGQPMRANREPRSGMRRPGPGGRGPAITVNPYELYRSWNHMEYDTAATRPGTRTPTPVQRRITEDLLRQIREHQRQMTSYHYDGATNSRDETPAVIEVSIDSTNPNTPSSSNT